jgi:hypothetical protein
MPKLLLYAGTQSTTGFTVGIYARACASFWCYIDLWHNIEVTHMRQATYYSYICCSRYNWCNVLYVVKAIVLVRTCRLFHTIASPVVSEYSM